MPVSRLSGFKISGVCCSLPANQIEVTESGRDFFDTEEIAKVVKMLGTNILYRAVPGQTAADLCLAAAEKLIDELHWEKESIDALFFISQTPDYILPATSSVLHQRLNLSSDCIVLDINLGCSGFIYGLWLAGQVINSGSCKRALVLVGDTLSNLISKEDRSVSLLFGDAGSATALEKTDDSGKSVFILQGDGRGFDSIIVPAGAARNPGKEETAAMRSQEAGEVRSPENLHMNGINVFLFSSREVPRLIEAVLKESGWSRDEVDFFLMHQANRYIINYLAEKAALPINKIPINIDKFGNTSGASLPLLICDLLADKVTVKNLKVVMAGFGTGFSWGGAALHLEFLQYAGIIYL